VNHSVLADRVGFVTGSAQGFGLAEARRLCASGARVPIWDMDGDLARDAARPGNTNLH